MATKRKPTKPVKAWAYVHRETGSIETYAPFVSLAMMRDRPSYRPAHEWRIARVEIREVGR